LKKREEREEQKIGGTARVCEGERERERIYGESERATGEGTKMLN
jgi:hypothetical protein